MIKETCLIQKCTIIMAITYLCLFWILWNMINAYDIVIVLRNIYAIGPKIAIRLWLGLMAHYFAVNMTAEIVA